MSELQIMELFQSSVIHNTRKDRFGEVHTPAFLITEILDAIPASAYTHTEWKWLEPAAGTGHFFLLLYLRLLKGLVLAIPNIEKRKTHIIENMLYMVEYNAKNVEILKHRFGKKCHIIHADFLQHDFGGVQFDGVLGNPPFQISKVGVYKGSAGNRTLWTSFIKKILETHMIKQHGYFGFLTPSSWRRPENSLYRLMVQDNHLRYLHIFSKKQGKEILHVQTRFDIYVIQQGATTKKSRIIDEIGDRHSIYLGEWPFLPNYAYDKFKQIMVTKEKGIPIIFDSSCYDARKLSKTRSKRKNIPVVHNITRKGLGIYYGFDNCKELLVPKVLLNFNEKQYPVNDYLGKYGMSQLTFGIPIQSKTDGNQWIDVIQSTFFQDLLKASKWNSFQTDYRMFSYFTRDKTKYR
jgi:hypothetical protein